MATSVYLIRHGAYDHRPTPEGTEASCDFGLSALGVQQARQPAREAEAASQAWKPWRSYAVVRAWRSLAAPQGD